MPDGWNVKFFPRVQLTKILGLRRERNDEMDKQINPITTNPKNHTMFVKFLTFDDGNRIHLLANRIVFCYLLFHWHISLTKISLLTHHTSTLLLLVNDFSHWCGFPLWFCLHFNGQVNVMFLLWNSFRS